MINPITAQVVKVWEACRYENLPDDVREIAKYCLLDNLGCALHGHAQPLVGILADELFAGERPEPFDLLPGSYGQFKPSDRAFLHAVAAHAVDFDDTFIPAKSAHMGNAVIGSALALAGEVNVSGEKLLAAIVAGYEVGARIGDMLDDAHYLNGFHPTGTTGIFGAAACSAKLLDFSSEQMAALIGLAATQASGLKCTFGTMAKPFNAGNAASSGVLAARLLQRGFTAPTNALEADKGYLDMYLGKNKDEIDVEPLGALRIRENLFKFHAACHATHAMAEGIAALQVERDIPVANVQSLSIGVPELSLKTASVVEPRTGLEGKFSFNHVAACALCGYSTASEAAFTDETVHNPEVKALRQRIDVAIVDGLPMQYTDMRFTMTDGEVIERRVDAEQVLLGDLVAKFPSIESKFLGVVSAVLGEGQAEQLCGKIKTLEHASDVASHLALESSVASAQLASA